MPSPNPASVLALAGLLAGLAAGCASSPSPQPSGSAATGAAERERESPAEPEPGDVAAVPPSPLAGRLCAVLWAEPTARRQACCGIAGASLEGLCVATLSEALDRGAVEVDEAAVERCAGAISAGLEGCDWVTPLLPPLPPACAGLLRGRAAEAAPCRSSLECAAGLRCAGVGADAPGRCAPPAAPRTPCERGADGLAAATRNPDDPRHPACDGRCAGGQCLPLVASGERCLLSALCPDGERCVDGRCRAVTPPALGERCNGSVGCAAGAFCAEGTCVAPRGAGEPCRLPFECRALACETVPGSPLGRCADPCRPGGR